MHSARYKDAPSPSGAHSIDALMILENAMGRVKGPMTRESLRDAIEQTDLHGANGHYKFSATVHGIGVDDLPIVFLKVADKKFVVQ